MPPPLFLRSVANTKREIAEIIDSYLHYKCNEVAAASGGGELECPRAGKSRADFRSVVNLR